MNKKDNLYNKKNTNPVSHNKYIIVINLANNSIAIILINVWIRMVNSNE